ncbi:uncharacterized protein UTRI_06240_B [Ustilago trichophora]|uniref:SnoaL-like domain-containing protein n=1 Tax=Ustilago trichophora TaxID=86804 RepID=A0A5C3EHR1_9BASI|nr:uncharacterized protein UTRI_06240_B [Ustilago trichophora]
MTVSAFAISLLLLVSTVFATKDASSADDFGVQRSLRRPRPFYARLSHMVAETDRHDTYAQRLRELLNDRLQLPHITVRSLTTPPISVTDLVHDIYHDRNAARFYFMGHSRFGQLDMVFTTPVTGQIRTDGSQVFALLSKHQKGPMHLHGYVEISSPENIKPAMSTWKPDLYLQPGVALKMDELLRELSLLRPPSWRGGSVSPR